MFARRPPGGIDLLTPLAFQIACNFTNAVFFWALLPETAKVPLEAMDTLWDNAPWLVPTMESRNYLADPEQREAEISEEQSAGIHRKEQTALY